MVSIWAAQGEAYALLLRALWETHRLEALPEIARAPGGKPYFPEYPQLYFNVSHSGPWALCGVGDVPVGVDIECLRPRKAALPQHALTPEEYRWYRENGGDWAAFYTLWTRKESYCKRSGQGLRGYRSLGPPLPGTAGEVMSWQGPGWTAALCAAGQTREQVVFRLISFRKS